MKDGLSQRQRLILNEVFRDLKSAISVTESRLLLEKRDNGTILLANPDLQPISFSLRHVSLKTYFYGVIGEILAWPVFLLSIVFWLLALIVVVAVALMGRVIWLRTGFFADRLTKTTYHFVHARWAARRRRYNAYKQLCADKRPPVLYLRSFSFDHVLDLPLEDSRRADERIAEFYERHGPVIAVAGPDDRGPMLGPVRLYFDEKVWRAGVTYLMSISQIVIIQSGLSQGTLWELGMARRLLRPDQIIIFVADASSPNTADSQYLDFKLFADRILGFELPTNLGRSVYITFRDNWQPFLQGDGGDWVKAEIKHAPKVRPSVLVPYETRFTKCGECGLGNHHEATRCERCGKSLNRVAPSSAVE